MYLIETRITTYGHLIAKTFSVTQDCQNKSGEKMGKQQTLKSISYCPLRKKTLLSAM